MLWMMCDIHGEENLKIQENHENKKTNNNNNSNGYF